MSDKPVELFASNRAQQKRHVKAIIEEGKALMSDKPTGEPFKHIMTLTEIADAETKPTTDELCPNCGWPLEECHGNCIFKSQLADERDKREHAERMATLLSATAVEVAKRADDLEKQLAAEREKVKYEVALRLEYQRELGYERGNIATLVDALDRVSRACKEELTLPYYKATNTPAVMGTFVALRQICDAALAKVKDK